jgi:predicted NBD/HSP70 family sugar kinase
MDWQVLQAVQRLGAVSQPQLASVMGRKRSTVNGAVQRLLSAGWLARAGQAGEGRGRPAILLAVNRSLGCFVGVDVAPGDMRLAVVGANGTLLDRVATRLGRDKSLEAVLDQTDLSVRGLLSRVGAGLESLLGIWAGVNGVVDERGVVVTCASLRWRGVALREALIERFGCETLVQGGASVMNAAAEFLMGAGREAENLVYFHVGRGISARMLQNGVPMQGATRRAGEFGHLVVDPGGTKCACGNRGCLEAVASGPAIAAAVKRVPRRQLPQGLRTMLGRSGSADPQDIARAALEHLNGPKKGPFIALLDQIAAHLAMGLAMAIAAYDPEVVVVGGYVFEDSPMLLNRVQKLLRTMVLDWDERSLRVIRGEVMSQDRAVAGAAEVCQRFWANPRAVLTPA